MKKRNKFHSQARLANRLVHGKHNSQGNAWGFMQTTIQVFRKCNYNQTNIYDIIILSYCFHFFFSI